MGASFPVIFHSRRLDILGLKFQESIRLAVLKAKPSFWFKFHLNPDQLPFHLDHTRYILGLYDKNKDYQ